LVENCANGSIAIWTSFSGSDARGDADHAHLPSPPSRLSRVAALDLKRRRRDHDVARFNSLVTVTLIEMPVKLT